MSYLMVYTVYEVFRSTMTTLREQVLATLRERVLGRQLKPGARLVESELAAELGVSRTPVRECLRVLEMEGLVENSPGFGVIVRTISTREVREALLVRSALDSLAIREAARSRTEEDLVMLEADYRLLELAVRAGDERRIKEADSAFHARIFAAAHNTVLVNVRNAFALYESFYFHPDFYRYTPGAFKRSQSRHKAMLEAVRAQDADQAALVAQQHIEEALALLRTDNCGSRESEAS